MDANLHYFVPFILFSILYPFHPFPFNSPAIPFPPTLHLSPSQLPTFPNLQPPFFFSPASLTLHRSLLPAVLSDPLPAISLVSYTPSYTPSYTATCPRSATVITQYITTTAIPCLTVTSTKLCPSSGIFSPKCTTTSTTTVGCPGKCCPTYVPTTTVTAVWSTLCTPDCSTLTKIQTVGC